MPRASSLKAAGGSLVLIEVTQKRANVYKSIEKGRWVGLLLIVCHAICVYAPAFLPANTFKYL